MEQFPTLFTLGHSNLSISAFLALLNQYKITCLVDIRSQPHSTRHQQYNQDALRTALNNHGIQYHWAGRQLGGLRKSQARSIHSALPESLHGFAEHMETDAFAIAAQQLTNMCNLNPTAIMCAEKHPEHCHRRLIADYLSLKGIEVKHIIPDMNPQPHILSPEARRESIQLIYDRCTTTDILNSR